MSTVPTEGQVNTVPTVHVVSGWLLDVETRSWMGVTTAFQVREGLQNVLLQWSRFPDKAPEQVGGTICQDVL